MKEQASLPQNREQDLGGLKGLSLEGTPIRRGSLEAFCIQKFFRSAAAWDTCRARHTSECVCWVGDHENKNRVFVIPATTLCTSHSLIYMTNWLIFLHNICKEQFHTRTGVSAVYL